MMIPVETIGEVARTPGILLDDDDGRHAAESVAFDVLDPALRSRGRPRQAALTLAADLLQPSMEVPRDADVCDVAVRLLAPYIT